MIEILFTCIFCSRLKYKITKQLVIKISQIFFNFLFIPNSSFIAFL